MGNVFASFSREVVFSNALFEVPYFLWPFATTCRLNLDISVVILSQVPEINGFLTAGRKKNGEVEDELDRSLEGMEHSDDHFDKGEEI